MIGEAIAEFVARVVVEVITLLIFRYPGALYLHIITLGRRSYDHWYNWGDGTLAGTVGILGTVALIGLWVVLA